MNYHNLTTKEVLALIDEKYSRDKQKDIALDLVADILEYNEEEMNDANYDPFVFLAEYFGTGECREWLIGTFLEED